MRTLSDREKRTIRVGVIGVAVYLFLFFGFRAWTHFQAVLAKHAELVRVAENTRTDFLRFENKTLLTEKLKQKFQLDPSRMTSKTLVADVSAAIQQAAASGGVKLGPVRETATRSSAHVVTSVQLEGVGAVSPMMNFLHKLESTGYPLLLESLQLTPNAKEPGKLSVNLTLVILDLESWENGSS